MERAEAIPKGSRGQAAPKRAGSECVACGSDERRIQGRGLCTRCYSREWRKTEDRTKWRSRKYPNGCIRCGTTEAKHQGHGLCPGCYSLDYKGKNPDRILELARECYHRNRQAVSAKQKIRYATDPDFRRKMAEANVRGRWGGNRWRALEEANFMCTACGYNKIEGVLEVHHIDGDRRNNVLSNLLVLCPTCHKEQHYGS